MTHTLNKTVGGSLDGFYVIAVHEINSPFDRTNFQNFTSKTAAIKFMQEVNQAYIPSKEQLEQFQF